MPDLDPKQAARPQSGSEPFCSLNLVLIVNNETGCNKAVKPVIKAATECSAINTVRFDSWKSPVQSGAGSEVVS